jgi:hypothetical protein
MSRLIDAFRLSRVELAGTAACVLAFTYWSIADRGEARIEAARFFAVFSLACLLAGRVCAKHVDIRAERDLPTVLLLGFVVLNASLYLLAWISPLPITANALFLLAAVVIAQVLSLPSRGGEEEGRADAGTGLLALILCLIAATLWAQDSLHPIVSVGPGIVVKPWFDSHFHACGIRMFRDARGYATLEDLRMAGQPPWLYHYASYMAPALLSACTKTPAYFAFTGFHVPFGIVLTGLATHAFVRSLWGTGAGVAALAALLLIPDAGTHGVQNAWWSYRWLQRIAPGGLYGVATLAVAWMLMLRGCRTSRLSLIAAAFLTTAFVFHYKAHLFVASAFLIWHYPGIFLRGVRWRWKGAWLAFALVTFFAAAGFSQRFDSIPTLRLDWSSVKDYAGTIGKWSRVSANREYLGSFFTPTSSWLNDLGWGTVLLYYASLGLCGVANIALAVVALARRARRKASGVDLESLAFPLLIALNYLLMSLGLSYDLKKTTYGLPDELRHRPFVWAYFVSAACAGGLSYRLYLEDRARRSRRWRVGLIALLFVLLLVPLTHGPRIQIGPGWGLMFSWRYYPRGWFESAHFLRQNAREGELVQDSEGDPKFALSAFCEHPAYAIAYDDVSAGPVLSRRLAEMREFQSLTEAESIRRFADERRIRWYVVHPGTRLAWPDSLLARPAYASGGFRIISFDPPHAGSEATGPGKQG